jgi:hypothetical protein
MDEGVEGGAAGAAVSARRSGIGGSTGSWVSREVSRGRDGTAELAEAEEPCPIHQPSDEAGGGAEEEAPDLDFFRAA